MTRPNPLLRLALAASILALAGCASVTYHANSYTAVIPDEALEPLDDDVEIRARFVQDFDAENRRMAERGYELVGFSKFTSPLVARFAERNAGWVARKKGATDAVLKPPVEARMNQRSYVTTFWRPIPADRYVLGAIYEDLDPNVLGSVGCPNNVVLLHAVFPGSPAERMGLQVADAIVFVDDVRIVDARALDEALGAKAGDEVTIRYVRAGQREEVKGRLAGAKGQRPAIARPDVIGLALVQGQLGSEIREMTGLSQGVFIDGVVYDTPACLSGLRTGDVVLGIGGRDVRQTDELAAALREARGTTTTMTLVRGLKKVDLPVDLADADAGTRARLDVSERYPGRPWELASGTDWTWLAITAQAITSASQQYNLYLEQERQRIEEYNRRQAYAASVDSGRVLNLDRSGRSSRAGPSRSSRRRGGPQIRTAGGDYVSVNMETAQMFQDNPGYYAVGTGRSLYIYDEYGRAVDVPKSRGSSGLVLPHDFKPQTFDMSYPDSLQQYFSQAPPSGNYGQEWADYGQYYSEGQ